MWGLGVRAVRDFGVSGWGGLGFRVCGEGLRFVQPGVGDHLWGFVGCLAMVGAFRV